MPYTPLILAALRQAAAASEPQHVIGVEAGLLVQVLDELTAWRTWGAGLANDLANSSADEISLGLIAQELDELLGRD